MVSYDNIFADIRFGPKDVKAVRVLRCFHSSSPSIDVFDDTIAEEIDENLEFRYFCIAMASSLPKWRPDPKDESNGPMSIKLNNKENIISHFLAKLGFYVGFCTWESKG